MTGFVPRFLEPLLRFLVPTRRPRRPADAFMYPYSCDYVAGPTAYRTGERPPRGEDSPLVRPYLVAFERESAATEADRAAAGSWHQRARRRALWVAVDGVDIGTRLIHGAEVVV